MSEKQGRLIIAEILHELNRLPLLAKLRSDAGDSSNCLRHEPLDPSVNFRKLLLNRSKYGRRVASFRREGVVGCRRTGKAADFFRVNRVGEDSGDQVINGSELRYRRRGGQCESASGELWPNAGDFAHEVSIGYLETGDFHSSVKDRAGLSLHQRFRDIVSD